MNTFRDVVKTLKSMADAGELDMNNSEKRAVANVLGADDSPIEMLEAIEAWFEYWDDRYDGEPLKDYEMKMLNVLRKAGRHV